MLNAVTVTNPNDESLTMELRNPERSGFLITSITGLGAPTASINITDLAAIDGGYYNSSRAQTRNIVFNIRFYSENSTDVEAIRQKTYKYFPIKKYVKLLFESSNRSGEISGYVEKNEPNIFSKETDCQISIICPFPYFYDAASGQRFIRFSDTVPAFQFRPENPFGRIIEGVGINELNDETELNTTSGRHIVFSTLNRNYQADIYYNGDAEIGMEMILVANGSVRNPRVYNTHTGDDMLILTEMNAGDQILINTTRGNKSVRRIRNGHSTSLLNKITRNSTWPVLESGINTIGFMAEDGIGNLTLTVYHRTLFEGM